MTHLWRDVLYSVRSLVRTPVLTATIVLTVGIGLGATTGMVSVIRAVLINPLPYDDANNLYWIYTDNPPFHFRFSVVDYRALEADHPTFSAIAAYQTRQVTVTEGGVAERVTAKDVTGSYFPLLGQKPAQGRLFDPSDDARGDRLAVLTYPYLDEALRRRSGGRRTRADDRRRQLHRRRRARADGRPARTGSVGVHRGALAHAATQGSVFHDGHRASQSGRVRGRRGAGAAGDEHAALSHLARVVPGRKSDVGTAGSQVARRRRRSDRRCSSCWRPSAACC